MTALTLRYIKGHFVVSGRTSSQPGSRRARGQGLVRGALPGLAHQRDY